MRMQLAELGVRVQEPAAPKLNFSNDLWANGHAASGMRANHNAYSGVRANENTFSGVRANKNAHNGMGVHEPAAPELNFGDGLGLRPLKLKLDLD